MAYSKETLENAARSILGSDPVVALGLPRASEECAVQLFLNKDAHPDAVEIIRESVSDLRDFGSFKFTKG